MGFAASQTRVYMLQARKTDLELQMQYINQAKMLLANTTGGMFQLTANLDPESPTAQSLQARIAVIQQIEKGLDLQKTRIEAQAKAIEAEFDSLKKIVEKNISSTFKLLS
jgi:capsule polysaccharide export protein KpsE/RkpR